MTKTMHKPALEDLENAGTGLHRSIPTHVPMQPALRADDPVADDVELGQRERARPTPSEVAEKIASDLEVAQEAESDARAAFDGFAGAQVLGEATAEEVQTAQDALDAAQRQVAALRSAQKLLEARAAAEEAQRERHRVEKLRRESKAAAAAQDEALATVAQSAEKLSSALGIVKAQGDILSALHQHIAEGDPQKAGELEQDRRDAVAQIGATFTQKRADIKNAATNAQYQAQRSSDGVDRMLGADLVLAGSLVARADTRNSEARRAVLDWELAALARLDQEQHQAQQKAHNDHAERVQSGLGAHLSASLEEVRAASNLDAQTLSMLVPDDIARALAGLTTWLPASAIEGIAVRAAPRTALEARQNEERLAMGKRAIQELVAN